MKFSQRLIDHLNAGGVAVMPTDTIYGVVCKASERRAFDRIYELKQREQNKRMTFIVAEPSQITELGIDETYVELLSEQLAHIERPTSIDMPIADEFKLYLASGFDSIAVRVTTSVPELQDLLRVVGPLATSSANISGHDHSKSAAEAKQFFGEDVLYEDHGELPGMQSALWSIRIGQQPHIIRK